MIAEFGDLKAQDKGLGLKLKFRLKAKARPSGSGAIIHISP